MEKRSGGSEDIKQIGYEMEKVFKYPIINQRSITLSPEESKLKDQYLKLLSTKKNPTALASWVSVSHKFGAIYLCFGDGIPFSFNIFS